MRLDVLLAERSLVDSRTDAKNFILSGAVSVNGRVIKKPSFDVSGDEDISVDTSGKKYASRGGLKLEAALDSFNINVAGTMALDVGASSGGFTDCLLKRGASRVIAVDSGSGQMVESLKNDSRVCLFENFNARYMTESDLEYRPDFVVMDVSFISSKHIIPAIASVIAADGGFVCLIKPQFEVGRSGLNKKGIVKNEALRRSAVQDVTSFASACGFKLIGIIESPIIGGDGNVEYLAYFKRGYN